MRSIGIDPSLTSTGVWVKGAVDFGKVVGESLSNDASIESQYERIAMVEYEVKEIIRLNGIEIVGMEWAAFANKSSRTVEMYSLYYFLFGACRHLGCSVYTVPPAQLKRWATGKGNTPKEEMLKAAKARGFDPPEGFNKKQVSDIADAFLAGEYAREQHHKVMEEVRKL